MPEDRNWVGGWILFVITSFMVWIILILLKLSGIIQMSWIGILLSLIWIPFVFMCIIFLMCSFIILLAHIKKRHRRKVVDYRIIRQAKNLGAWRPQTAGGIALELLAQKYGLYREEGETDKELRERILDAIEQMCGEEKRDERI